MCPALLSGSHHVRALNMKSAFVFGGIQKTKGSLNFMEVVNNPAKGGIGKEPMSKVRSSLPFRV